MRRVTVRRVPVRGVVVVSPPASPPSHRVMLVVEHAPVCRVHRVMLVAEHRPLFFVPHLSLEERIVLSAWRAGWSVLVASQLVAQGDVAVGVIQPAPSSSTAIGRRNPACELGLLTAL